MTPFMRRAEPTEQSNALPGHPRLGAYHVAREQVIAQFEVAYLTTLLERAQGNMSLAARLAGIDRTTLYRLMGRHHLPRQSHPSLPTHHARPEVA